MNTITVKVIRMPAGSVVEVAVNEGDKVQNALTAAGFEVAATETLTLNATVATTDTILNEGDRIILAKESKGA